MGFYIKVSGTTVKIGGQVANEIMKKQGWFEYTKEIPSLGENQEYIYEDDTIKVIDKNTTIEQSNLVNVNSITLRQAKLILNKKGLLNSIEEAINSIEDSNLKTEIKIEWEYANNIDISNPLIKFFQEKLSLTDEQVQSLFNEGSTL